MVRDIGTDKPAQIKSGGERGIRTLDTLPYTHFPGVRLQPLGHLSTSTLKRALSWKDSLLILGNQSLVVGD